MSRLFAERLDLDQAEGLFRRLRLPRLGRSIPGRLLDAKAGPLVVWRGRPYRWIDWDGRRKAPVLTPILPAMAGGALDFNGSSAYLNHGDIAAFDSASALTLAAWTNTDTIAAGNAAIATKGPNGATTLVFRCYRQAATVLVGFSDGVDVMDGTSGNILSAGTWQHVVFAFDGAGVGNANRLKTYVDGASQGLSFSGTIPSALRPSSAEALAIGALLNSGTPSTYFAGLIGLVKIWTAALSAGAVANERPSYWPPTASGLILFAPYDDGTSARDYSGSGNHGTVTGATAIDGPPVNVGSPIFV